MRTLFLAILLASTSAWAAPADNASLSGKWKLHSDIMGNESDIECTFTQKESDLGGTCATESGDQPLAGKIDGPKITWSYNAEYQGTALTVKYKGTLDSAATKLSGTVSVDPFGVDGDFTAAPTK
jgi:hypothetical protein